MSHGRRRTLNDDGRGGARLASIVAACETRDAAAHRIVRGVTVCTGRQQEGRALKMAVQAADRRALYA